MRRDGERKKNERKEAERVRGGRNEEGEEEVGQEVKKSDRRTFDKCEDEKERRKDSVSDCPSMDRGRRGVAKG